MKLKHCPFCGNTKDLYVCKNFRWYVVCDCKIIGPERASKEEAIEAWNRRYKKDKKKCK